MRCENCNLCYNANNSSDDDNFCLVGGDAEMEWCTRTNKFIKSQDSSKLFKNQNIVDKECMDEYWD